MEQKYTVRLFFAILIAIALSYLTISNKPPFWPLDEHADGYGWMFWGFCLICIIMRIKHMVKLHRSDQTS